MIGLIVGHTPDEVGAVNSAQQIGEWHYNATLARMVDDRVEDSQIILRDRPNDWSGLPEKVNATGVDFAVSMHLNAADGEAKGSEVLYWHSSSASEQLATCMQDEFLVALPTSNRGEKARGWNDRGSLLLRETSMPIVICEPGFIDSEFEMIQRRTNELADAYVRGIQRFRDRGLV